MVAIDTNILFHAFNSDSPSHEKAWEWVSGLSAREDVVISEFILAELYRLVRNPVVVKGGGLSAKDAVALVETFRKHPKWMIVGFPLDSKSLHDRLWHKAREKSFAYRRLFDVRTALTLLDYGVDEIATCNIKDFLGLGFSRVWNPLDE